MIIGSAQRIFFSCDSGYSKGFAKIGAAYRPFKTTLIKINAYWPSDFWHDVHMTPKEMMQTSLDLRVILRVSALGDLNLAYYDWREPIRQALAAAQDKAVRLATLHLEQMLAPEEALPTSK